LKKKFSKAIFVSPFGLVLFLTLITLILALLWGENISSNPLEGVLENLLFWQSGFFSLLEFTLQMMMILVFGYSLAIFKPIHSALFWISNQPKTTLQAVLFTGAVTMLAGLVNWGFGLIIGALLARFMAISQAGKGNHVNPAILAAAGYLGMAVWHGGLSGSAPLLVAQPSHFLSDQIGTVPIQETVLSSANLWITGGLVAVFLITLGLLNRLFGHRSVKVEAKELKALSSGDENRVGQILGLLMIFIAFVLLVRSEAGLGSLNLNLVNFLFFGATLIAYKSIERFTSAVTEGIKSSVDIFIQFPFYAGILGVLTESGLIQRISTSLLSIGSETLIPYIIFFSSACINILVPSGGGQWAVQGPIIIETAKAIGLPIGQMVMVFSYGDQISNLLQPFWALPLLAITGVPARKMFTYCFWLFLAGFTFLLIAIGFLLVK